MAIKRSFKDNASFKIGGRTSPSLKETKIRNLAADLNNARLQQNFERKSLAGARDRQEDIEKQIKFLKSKNVSKKEQAVRIQFLPDQTKALAQAKRTVARIFSNTMIVNKREEKLAGEFQAISRGKRQNLLSR